MLDNNNNKKMKIMIITKIMASDFVKGNTVSFLKDFFHEIFSVHI